MMRKVLFFVLWTFILIRGYTVYGEEPFPIDKIKDMKVVELNPTDCMSFNEYVQKDLDEMKKYQWWSTLYPLVRLNKFTFTTTASSTLGDAYKSANLCDGKVETAWVPGVKGGIGEWAKISIDAYFSLSEYTSTPFSLEKIGVLPGYAKSSKIGSENNRVKKLLVVAYSPKLAQNEWIMYRLNLKDKDQLQLLEIPDEEIGFSMSYMKKTIWIKIEDIYKGTKYDDTCISEFVAVGRFSS